jgi:transcription initiation factor TFIID subunit TAF12
MQQQEMQLRQMQQQQQQQQQQQRGQSAHNALGVPGHSGEGFDVSGSGSLLGNFNTDTNLQALGISRTGEEMPPSGMVSQNQFNYLGNNF